MTSMRCIGGSLRLASSPALRRSGTSTYRTCIPLNTPIPQRGRGALRIQARAFQTTLQSDVLAEERGIYFAEPAAVPLPEPAAVKPGVADDSRFGEHWSVKYWRDFRIPQAIRDESLPLTTRMQALVDSLQVASQRAGVLNSPQSIVYWSYHLARMNFFALQGVAGVAFSNMMQQRSSARGSTSGTSLSSSAPMDVGKMLRSGIYIPVSESLAMFYQDYENIRRGFYKMPWDMTPGHKQTNPLNILDKSVRFIREASATLQRRARGSPDKVWLESGLYPEYYLNSWHYQTDGWLSEESAKVYETSTETVFIGRQDAMQRQSLVPLKDFMLSKGSRNGEGMQMLEVACGTGRFATFVKDNYPRLGMTQLDLSPFYLQEARKNMEYWRRMRGGPLPEDTAASKDSYLHAPAEKIPTPDDSFDVVLSIYLFHELPEDARRKAVSEMARVVKPGGMVIMTDGMQLGDRPINDATQKNFQAFNEPNWGTHIAIDYGALFSEFGLVPHQRILASGSKVLSFTKPATRS